MAQIPLRIGDRATFDRVRETFRKAAFDEETVKQRKEKGLIVFQPYKDGIVPADADGAEIFMGMFLRLCDCPEKLFRGSFGDGALEDFRALGLVEDAGDGMIRGTARIRPMYKLYACSDRWDNSTNVDTPVEADVVFPPDTSLTIRYLDFLPRNNCNNFLEACG